MNSNLSRGLPGYLFIITSILLISFCILLSTTLPASIPVLDGVKDSHWPILSVLAFVLAILLLLVVIGLYIKQIDRFGIFGLIGFVIAVIGSTLNSSMLFDMAFVWPSLAVHAPELIDFEGPLFQASLFSIAHNLINYLGTIGFAIFGIAMIRARVFPRLSSILFAIGMILMGVILFPPFILRSIGSLFTAVSLLWIGVILLRGSVIKE